MNSSQKPGSTSTENLPDGQEVTELENSMVNIIKVFHCYAGKNCKLRKKDLKQLINAQMSTFVKKVQDTETLNTIFEDLDANHDHEIDFSEFATLVAMVTSACHTSFHSDDTGMMRCHRQ